MKLVVIPIIGFLAVVACSTPDSLETGATILSSPQQRVEWSLQLENRLAKVDPRKPIFGTQSKTTQEEAEILVEFVNMIPSGTFIFGGHPTYWININKTEQRGFESMKRVEYSVEIIHRETRQLIATSVESGRCMESEAIMVFPTRCSIMRGLVLQRALENL